MFFRSLRIRNRNGDFYFARRARKLRYYGDVVHSFYSKSAVEHDGVFKMRDSVPSARYSLVCNVLRQWKPRSSLLTESTDSMISKDERGLPLTQYITN